MDKNNEKTEKQKTGLGTFLRGNILARKKVRDQFPFVIFLVFLGLLLITNRYRSEKIIRQIELVQDTIDDLKSQSITNSARLMRLNTPSVVYQKVRDAHLGLEEPIRPPTKIVVDKIKNK